MFGKLISYEKHNYSIKLNYEKKPIFVDVISDKAVRFYEERESKSFAVEAYELSSDFSIKFDTKLVIETKEIKIVISDEFKVIIYDLMGNEILSDCDLKASKDDQNVDSDLLALEGHKSHDGEEYKFLITKKLHNDECFFGLGDKTGFLNKREYEYIMWNTDDPAPQVDCFKSLYKSIPFFIGHHDKISYGVFLDNTYKSVFNMGTEDDVFYFGSVGGTIDYYFFYGPQMKDVMTEYTNITGRYPLPQIWTLGNQQSRWSYANKEAVDEIVDGYQKNNIPLDVIHLDIDYMEDYKVFTHSEEKFPDMKNYIATLAEKGIKVVCIIDPGVKALEGYNVYDEGIKNNYFATLDGEVYHNAVWPGDSVFPAFTSNRVQSWWANNTKYLTELGVRGIWNDMNEPASFKGPLPNDVVFSSEDKDYLHEEVHNVYGHLMAKATYEGLAKTNKRPYIITRACYAGSQKYTTAWTGDNHSIWAHLQMAPVQLCNLGLSGMPFVGTDVGGFGSHCTKELMARWVMVGAFSPLFRNHSAMGTKYQEPWQFDQELTDIYRKYVELRYQLIPYYYDLFRLHEQTGYPVMRPVVFNYENDEVTYNLNDEFMVGDNILVSPVVVQGERKKLVYLPNDKWYSHETKELVEAGYSIASAKLDECPIYVKGGSIIPKYEKSMHIANNIDKLILDVYPGDGEYTHYVDDKETFSYQQGEYSLYFFKKVNEELTIELIKDDYKKLYKEFEIHYQNKIIKAKASNKLTIKL